MRLRVSSVSAFAASAALALPSQAFAVSIAALGDSLSVAWGADGSTGAPDLAESWATGTDPGVNSHASRLAALGLGGSVANYAVPGQKMAATLAQADAAVSQGGFDYVTLFAGTNDVCSDQTVVPADMTSVADYTTELRATLADLTTGLPTARILVVSIPNWYGLWSQYQSDSAATSAWTSSGRCPILLGSGTSTANRLAVQTRISDLNAADASVCAEFANCTYDGGAAFGLSFSSTELTFDYFHLLPAGQGALAQATWKASLFQQPVNAGCRRSRGRRSRGRRSALRRAPGRTARPATATSGSAATVGGSNCNPISNATSQTYLLAAADVGSTIRVAVTASNPGGPSSPASSNQTAVVTSAPLAGRTRRCRRSRGRRSRARR